MTTKHTLLILWLTIFVLDIIMCATDAQPTWLYVFSPLVCYIMTLVGDVLTHLLDD